MSVMPLWQIATSPQRLKLCIWALNGWHNDALYTKSIHLLWQSSACPFDCQPTYPLKSEITCRIGTPHQAWHNHCQQGRAY